MSSDPSMVGEIVAGNQKVGATILESVISPLMNSIGYCDGMGDPNDSRGHKQGHAIVMQAIVDHVTQTKTSHPQWFADDRANIAQSVVDQLQVIVLAMRAINGGQLNRLNMDIQTILNAHSCHDSFSRFCVENILDPKIDHIGSSVTKAVCGNPLVSANVMMEIAAGIQESVKIMVRQLRELVQGMQ